MTIKNADDQFLPLPWEDQEFPDFVPNDEELLQLVKFWFQVSLTCDWWYFAAGVSSSGRRHFATCRISRIEDILGPDRVIAVQENVHEEFRKTVSPERWDIFLNGDEYQSQAVREEFYQKLEEAGQKHENPDAGGSINGSSNVDGDFFLC